MSIAGGAPGTASDGYRTATPAEPTGELREQVAQWLFRKVMDRERKRKLQWEHLELSVQDGWLNWADELLSGPLAPLLDAQAAVKRAEAVLGEHYWLAECGRVAVAADRLRAALAAPQTGQHTADEDSNTADELAAAGLRACCGQPSERHCR